MNEDTLSKFVLALHRGDTSEIERHEPAARASLARFCRGYLGDPDAADDAVQEIIARAARGEQSPRAPKAWLLTIARNHCLDLARALAARPDDARLATSFEARSHSAGPLTKLVGAEREQQLERALDSLASEQRELLRLRYHEDLSRAEIAELLATTEEIVKSRLYEAIEKLRGLLHARDGAQLDRRAQSPN